MDPFCLHQLVRGPGKSPAPVDPPEPVPEHLYFLWPLEPVPPGTTPGAQRGTFFPVGPWGPFGTCSPLAQCYLWTLLNHFSLLRRWPPWGTSISCGPWGSKGPGTQFPLARALLPLMTLCLEPLPCRYLTHFAIPLIRYTIKCIRIPFRTRGKLKRAIIYIFSYLLIPMWFWVICFTFFFFS
ncbi:MAG: hypothetical protein CM15mP9_0020 [Methanobacteriota archaeon]|nr:MAG: hypothetical protein CM15mP9_0020 [Euryarchaeota archaeon]